MAQWQEPDLSAMLRTLTAARLLLPAGISLQAPPNLSDEFECYLDAGINDWGGISPLTADFINPERAWPAVAEVARRSRQRGFELAERLTVYPRYIDADSGFVSPSLFATLGRAARADGLARAQFHQVATNASIKECA